MTDNTMIINLDNYTADQQEQLMAIIHNRPVLHKPVDGERYFAVINGDIEQMGWCDDKCDNWQYATGNCHMSPQQAKAYKEETLVRAQLERLAREYNEGWTPDWTKLTQKKWFMYVQTSGYNIHASDVTTYSPLPNTWYFKSREACQKAIDTIGVERLLRYFFKVIR